MTGGHVEPQEALERARDVELIVDRVKPQRPAGPDVPLHGGFRGPARRRPDLCGNHAIEQAARRWRGGRREDFHTGPDPAVLVDRQQRPIT